MVVGMRATTILYNPISFPKKCTVNEIDLSYLVLSLGLWVWLLCYIIIIIIIIIIIVIIINHYPLIRAIQGTVSSRCLIMSQPPSPFHTLTAQFYHLINKPQSIQPYYPQIFFEEELAPTFHYFLDFFSCSSVW